MIKPSKTKSIVCIGGGTGTFVVLRGIKKYPYLIKAIVSVSDSGGSNKRIRDEFGLLPTSDLRQCFVALSDENGGVGLLRKLFMYRFDKGKGISGMTFGNLFMAALSDILGSQAEAIRQTGKVLRIKGSVIPVSYTDTNLYAEYEGGLTLKEEHLIDEPKHDGTIKINKIYLKPEAQANPDATEAISNADMIVIGPGDLYTSVIPNFLIRKVSEQISSSDAKVVYVMNLMTKYGQTYGYTAKDHLRILEDHIGKAVDYVIINTGQLSAKALALYQASFEAKVTDDLNGNSYFKVIRENVVSNQIVHKSESDMLVRSLIRHDSDKLAQLLIKILENKL